MFRAAVLTLVGGVIGCSQPAPKPAAAPDEGPQIVFVPPERDPEREATDKLITEIYKKQLKQKERADAARAQAEHEGERSEDEWLAVARAACRPGRCDGSPVSPTCAGVYDIPAWARVQAATEACAREQPAAGQQKH